MDNHTENVKFEMTKGTINSMSQEQISLLLTQLELKNLNFKGEPNSLFISFKIYFDDDEMTENGPRSYDISRVYTKRCQKFAHLTELKSRIKIFGIQMDASNDYEGHEFTLIDRIHRLMEVYNDAYEQILYHTRIMERTNHPMSVPIKLDSDGSTFRYCPIDENDEKKSTWQDLLLYLLHELNQKRYKRCRDNCMEEIKINGKSTRAWRPIMTIKDFIGRMTSKETKFDQWKNLTSKSSCREDTLKYLTDCIDIQFQDLKRDRHVWSYSHGIFIGNMKDEMGTWYSQFSPDDSDEFDYLDPTIVSCKYFDVDFKNHEGDWYDISTPYFQSIMDVQGFEPEVCKWLYVFCGRLCYDIGELDSWQVIPFLKGIAGTGKGMTIKAVKKFYDVGDVRTLSNNCERKFGLENLYDGLFFVGPEIKGDLGLEQAEFQSMVSGEGMSIARKFKKPIDIDWKIHGVVAGNENPGWKDNSGSILRRLVTWYFAKAVPDNVSDPNLEEKVLKEASVLLHKCVKAYIEYSNMYRQNNIWDVLPPYFKIIKSQMEAVTSILLNFLKSEKVVYSKDRSVPLRIFTQMFNRHCEENNFPKQKFTQDLYAGPFQSREIEIHTKTDLYNQQNYINQPFVIGLDIVDINPVFGQNNNDTA